MKTNTANTTPAAVPSELKDRKAEPQMGNVGRILRSKKGNYTYIVTAQMEGNLTIRWMNLDGTKTAYSYTRNIKIAQIGGRDYEEIFPEAKAK